MLPLLIDTTAQSIFDTVDTYFVKNDLSWDLVYQITTDGCPSMIGIRNGFVALGKFNCFNKKKIIII